MSPEQHWSVLKPEEFDPRRALFWRNQARMLLFNTAIAVLITAFQHSAFIENLVYSQCIGNSIWLGVMSARRFGPNPSVRIIGMVCAVIAGTVLGWTCAAMLLGHPWRSVVAYFLVHWTLAIAVPVTASLVNVYYYINRERLARVEAELATQRAEKLAAEQAAARALAVAELAALQAQIEPHFLFNTLANLRSLISRDPATAQHMLDRLITYLRSTLHTARAREATLGEEFAQIEAYLDILRIRMGARLRFTLELPPTLALRRIPPMLLQPLVENAIRHGLEPKIEGGSLSLTAQARDGKIELTVTDDGMGFGVAETAGTGVGLANVRERLRALFGDNARLEIESPPAGGVRVCLQMPETTP